MRFLIGILVAIGLLVLILVLIFTGGGGPRQKAIQLGDYANTSAVVRLTIDGSVSAPETHRQIQIAVGNNQSTLNIIKGYSGQVISSKSYDNSVASYQVFLLSIGRFGFTSGSSNPKLQDERGYCPLGVRYIFELQNGSNELERYWTSSCGGGTFRGNTDVIIALFQRQIPDYSSLAGNVNL